MKYLLFIFILFILLGCDLGIYENPYKDCKYRPFTKKEKQLIKSLETTTNRVDIFRTEYSYRPNHIKCIDDIDFYQISILDVDSVRPLNIDSLDILTRQLVENIYTNILFDSLRFSIVRYEVSIDNFSENPEHRNNYCGIISKTDIESYLGWKLVPVKRGYKRVIIPKTKELKIRKGECS